MPKDIRKIDDLLKEWGEKPINEGRYIPTRKDVSISEDILNGWWIKDFRTGSPQVETIVTSIDGSMDELKKLVFGESSPWNINIKPGRSHTKIQAFWDKNKAAKLGIKEEDVY